ncbi:MAG: MBL fold metallo-hydrolase [Leptospiraceae bacterium]|nr:MBL fold metallo-hydrolase [Leptospiraceae bacterium]MDW8307533.1 MBL fold metallo-hydrolase [Leptospiraceae bacterium]
MKTKFLFYQLLDYESNTYTYLLADGEKGEAVLIDPVKEQVDRDLKLIEELGLKLKYALDTHVHADHITAAGTLRERTQCKTAVGEGANVECADHTIRENDSFCFGDFTLKAISTPGHTDTCMSFYLPAGAHNPSMVFTGDCLLIRGCGRTDFQQGSAEKMYYSIKEKLYRLSDETLVYPGHDYQGRTHSTIYEEKRFNPRIHEKTTLGEFQEIMASLKLAPPKKIQIALPANLVCGSTAHVALA